MFGVKRFNSYLFGHHFILQTDHEPLRTLFNDRKAIPPQASSRIQRWALTLASYQYTIMCRKTGQHLNADAMSRLPLPFTPAKTTIPPELVLTIQRLQEAPITADQIAQWTTRDPVQAKVLRCLSEGWPSQVDDDLRPYWSRKLELSVHDGCLMWGGKVVIPPPGRKPLLVELHGAHPGVSRMKSLAQSLMWWPGMDCEIEDMVKHCMECQQDRPAPPPAPLHPWNWPTRPWARLHIEFAGPMEGSMFLIVIDVHSKWLEVFPMKTASAQTTIRQLRTLFARFGLPESIVSDNGSQFTAAEFEQFCQQNGINHIKVAPYHPSSNGLAERAVQIFKRGMKKSTIGTIGDRLAKVLMQYRVTPHTTTGVSPAELLLGRKPRTRLDLIKPNLQSKIENKQQDQKESHDKKSRNRHFVEGESVLVRNHREGEEWLPGCVEERSGPVSFRVKEWQGATMPPRSHLKVCHRGSTSNNSK